MCPPAAVAWNESVCPAEPAQPDKALQDVLPPLGDKTLPIQDTWEDMLVMMSPIGWALLMTVVMNAAITGNPVMTVAAG